MKKYFVTVDDEEIVETFSPDGICVFCEKQGVYRMSEGGIGFCLECMYENYKDKIRVEDI